MKKKILVIFLFAIIVTFIIYKYASKDENNILIIGEENINLNLENAKTNSFLYDNITYKELINCIKSDDYVTIKGKKIYLNKLISKSDYIIITASKNDCVKNKKISSRKNEQLNNLIKILNKISNSKIYILEYCSNINISENAELIKIDDINKVLKNK